MVFCLWGFHNSGRAVLLVSSGKQLSTLKESTAGSWKASTEVLVLAGFVL